MYTLYGDILSGNCYKAYLTMSLLNIEHRWCNINVMSGETSTDEYRQKNPNAKIPLLEVGQGQYLAESNAIVNYLAHESSLIPKERYLLAKVFEWQFFEQYSHEPYIAVARFIRKYLGLPEERVAEYKMKQPGGHRALSIMERQLNQTEFLTSQQITVADISLYAYTHVAEEGGFDLERYPAIKAWLTRIQKQPNYVGMELKAQHSESI